MKDVQSDLDIHHAVLYILPSWRNGAVSNYHAPYFLKDALDQQTTIGWQLFFEGWIAREWEQIQQAYYIMIKSRRAGKRRLVFIINKLWQSA